MPEPPTTSHRSTTPGPPPGGACASCGHSGAERFCPRCGERRLEPGELSLRGFAGESLAALTDVDSSAMRTARALLARPGLLTAEYVAGRRTRYLRPVQVFFLCNVLYFFAQPFVGANTLTSQLRVHTYQLPYSGLVRPLVEAEIASRGVDAREYAILFDATIASHAKALVFVMVPLFAVVLALLYPGVRRSFVQHVVFSTHFFSAFLLALLALAGAIHLLAALARATGTLGAWIQSDPLWTAVLSALLAAYLYPALRRAYGDGRAAAALRAAALVVSLAVVVQLYRFILFFTTFHAI